MKTRDSSYITRILHHNVISQIAGAPGTKTFQKAWQPELPTSQLWPTLSQILLLGGSFQDGLYSDTAFCAPYIYSEFPNDLDPFEYQVITGGNVDVRQEPSQRSRRVARLSYAIVKSVPPSGAKAGKQWVKVVMLGGQVGYVRRESIRSPLDYRACFEKVDGKWKLVALVSGD